MTIDNEQAVILTKAQFKELIFTVSEEMTTELMEKSPKMALTSLFMGAMFTAKLEDKIFGEEKPETEEAKPELKFGDE